VKSQNTSIIEKKFFEYENDTLKITYSVWSGKGGIISFTVFNKLNIPIYIDWKKSSIIKNEQKYNYWIDESNTEGKTTSWSSYSALYFGGYRLFEDDISFTNSKTIKPERITFISPKSSISRVQKDLFNLAPEKISKPFQKGTIKTNDGKKDVPVNYIEMNEANSYFKFRNFLTISTNENFEKEIFIDNDFFVNRVNKIKTVLIEPYNHYNDKKRKYELVYPLSSPKQFYFDYY